MSAPLPPPAAAPLPALPSPWRIWLVVMLLWSVLIGASLSVSISQIQTRNESLLREGARNVSRTLLSARAWNSRFSGVYAPIGPNLQPNPYLHAPHRDVQTTEQQALTLVNPAFMTRMISEIISNETPLRVRLASLRPLNPVNAADAWERDALRELEGGLNEVSGRSLDEAGLEVFRFIAPLRVEQSCLACHTDHIGDVRGGLSITQAFGPVAVTQRAEIFHTSLAHGAVWLLLGLLCYVMLEILHRHWRENQTALANIVQSEKMASLGRLVAGFAHELNTPVGVALGAVSHGEEISQRIDAMFAREEVSEDEVRPELEALRQSASIATANLRRAASLVQGFKRSSIDMSQEEWRDFELGEMIAEALLALRSVYKHCAEIEVSCPPHTVIHSIPGLLDQILTNLVVNSVTHGFAAGTRQGHIRIVAEPHPEALVLSYADDGAGMSEEVLQRIFEPFFTTRRGEGGSGLGLYICYTLVTTRLGGSIRCDSSPGAGTHFLITLPLNRAPETRQDENHPQT